MNTHASGRVSIYDENDRLLDHQLYYSKAGRETIIEAFKIDYKYEARYIQIQPYNECKEARVKKRIIKLVVEPKQPFVRPPAIYDNVKSAYGL
jgi:hypothetical protein